MTNIGSRMYTGIVSGLLFFGLYGLLPSLFMCLLFSLACWMILVEWPRVNAGGNWWLYGYPLLPLFLLITHVASWRDTHWAYGVYPFIAAWLVDAAGYAVGMRWGKHLCWPSVSPRKTWEGVAAGIVVIIVFHATLFIFKATIYPSWLMLCGAPLVAIAAMLGDFLVSWHKRQRGIKDTGALLPGHGGLLDRFDSVLAVIVVVKVCEIVWFIC